ncbi:hypothetical protein [Pontibacter pamirensis]|uniref:hypothetical protein n=1 Tax=Pontibacter pamirensis TaxID=2562824 RepID=UPI00138A1CF6|nr:hypothetical protein [Pontibacter pamirensis]
MSQFATSPCYKMLNLDLYLFPQGNKAKALENMLLKLTKALNDMRALHSQIAS